MVSGGALICAATAIIMLVLSGLWAEYRFRRFDRLPAHFDWTGRPTRYATRSFVIWLTPAIFAALIITIVFAINFVPKQYVSGDPSIAVMLASAIIVLAHGFVLWMINRWADGRIRG